jgi:two-component system phosphate regulon sensor histidine kinase PhoR
MRRRHLVWKLYFSYTLLTVLALIAVGWMAAVFARGFYLAQTRQMLEAKAHWVEAEIEPMLEAKAEAQVNQRCQDLGKKLETRITVILPDGRVIADSMHDPRTMENHGDRPEVIESLNGESEQLSRRYSHTLRSGMVYLAIPHLDHGRVAAVIRTAISMEAFDQALRGIYGKLALSGLIIALLGACLSFWISHRLSRPWEEMRQEADALVRGDLNRKLRGGGSDEISGLADSLNQMAGQLDRRQRSLQRQQHEQETVLANMVEGVLLVDQEEKLVNMNHAAELLFGVEFSEAKGRCLQEVIRNVDLHRLVARTLESSLPVTGEISIYGANERFMLTNGAPLRDEQKRVFGALVVLNDITQLRRLENVRREFVANVSHELKTPVTLIQGFVETLLDGAMEKREEAKRFLQIIFTHAKRLDAIIEDLLSLSRLEQADQNSMPAEDTALEGLLEKAEAFCQEKAQLKGIQIIRQCEPGLMVKVNPNLIQQAVVNLIENAIKYSEPRRAVRVEAGRDDREIKVRVIDQGCGIAAEHLPRIFERFYRVDKARSRQEGGTGLGLAIVKHILQAHGGRVTVESTVGQGSTFTLHFPPETS